MSKASRVLGWDVGGANVKAAVVQAGVGGRTVHTRSRPFEIWRDKHALPGVLRALTAELPAADSVAVTMTAELSDVFRTKREGVGFVLDAVEAVSRGPVRVFTTAGELVDVATARAHPLDAAASNWVATAVLVGRFVPEALLVYTGVVRTNVAAIVRSVPLRGGECPVASELFAVSGDVHVLLGSLAPDDYTGPTPDGRPPSAEFAAERLARVVCGDREMLGAEEIRAIAVAVAEAQVEEVAAAITRVAHRVARPLPVIATGLGSFLARRAAERAGMPSEDLAAVLKVDVGVAAPAVAVAWLALDGVRL